MKKHYQTPVLERFGTVAHLSAGGSGGTQEADPAPSLDAEFNRRP